MYIVFFTISVLFATQVKSLQHNFTYFSYTSPYQILYIIWFSTVGIGIYLKLYALVKSLDKQTRIRCHIALLLYYVGCLLPYNNTQNLFSTLHILFSLIAIILVFLIIYNYLYEIAITDSIRYQKLFSIIQIGLFFFFPICYINGSINIIVELYCLGFLLYVLYCIEKYEKKWMH